MGLMPRHCSPRKIQWRDQLGWWLATAYAQTPYGITGLVTLTFLLQGVQPGLYSRLLVKVSIVQISSVV
jgi:hypothetical protein